MNIEENNLLLEFLGFELVMDDPINSPDGYWHNGEFPLHADELEFDNNWNHLMFLIDRIETLETEFDGRFTVSIRGNECIICSSNFDSRPNSYHPSYFMTETLPIKIESVYYCVKCFCYWYNQNHKK